MAVASPAFSQAPIVDLSGDNTGEGTETSTPANQESSYSQNDSYGDTRAATASQQYASAQRGAAQRRTAQSNPQADAYYQMQVLQQEVQELRGSVEELRHEVKRLKQQRTEDYMDLDRRITRLSGAAPAEGQSGEQAAGGEQPAVAGADNRVSGSASASGDAAAPAASKDERERYQASFGLARNGDYAGASKEFKRLLKDFPDGKYAPNANYWLGEIALVQGNLEEARQWFVALLDGYPNSSKVWDGRYKLGTVYHQLGDDQKARDLLEQVAKSDARAAGLAKKYLEQNF
ncbi:tol-pal system protein YbgF [Microbulbifer sp. SAOS-129_SWC]|uniref:tol-pal system protein YbgF n=1 Tax=Microbulbifer sp. SAOS-129_SWC TaxID=3145235 RepID=UPI00321716FA